MVSLVTHVISVVERSGQLGGGREGMSDARKYVDIGVLDEMMCTFGFCI